MPKFLRYIGSGLEERITESFCNVGFSKEIMLEKRISFFFQGIIKRGVDLLFSCVLIIMSFPMFVIIALAIKISSAGPIFFKQERIGYKGKVFLIWKFRTMRQENSEEEHRQYIQYMLREGNRAENRNNLLAEYIAFVDERTTRVGSFLRATSLDELPQLINILLGEMSLVGPRPHPIYEVKEYKKWYKRRLNVKPGLTGWSKLNLRCTPQNYEEAILYDLWYVDNWNLTLDLRIILMTIPYILSMQDAH